MTMFFRKKSEDPWDRVPQRPAAVLTEAAEEPAEISSEEPAPTEQAMRCPWCGKEMTRGELRTVRPIWWVTEEWNWKRELTGYDPHKSLRVDDEGCIGTYKTAWHCWDCRKMVIDTEGMMHPYETETQFDVRAQEREDKEKDNGSALF